MKNKYKGQLVFLTVHVERWYKDLNTEFNIPMANRLSKVIKVFDWSSKEGKLLLKMRECSVGIVVRKQRKRGFSPLFLWLPYQSLFC